MIFNIFSKRNKAKQEPVPYQYDKMPEKLRNQMFFVLRDTVNASFEWDGMNKLWWHAWDFYCKEKGLPPNTFNAEEAGRNCMKIIMKDDIEAVFDIIEIVFGLMASEGVPQNELEKHTKEINRFFREVSFGYQFKGNQIMRIDSSHINHEAVEPVLDFLRGNDFRAANKKFWSALKKYRSGEYEHCITDANSAFESVMRVICKQKEWNSTGTADDLIKTLSKKGFIPNYLQSYFAHGLPPLRHNQGSAHGPLEPVEVPAYMAGYSLHLAATNILFLMQRADNLKTT